MFEDIPKAETLLGKGSGMLDMEIFCLWKQSMSARIYFIFSMYYIGNTIFLHKMHKDK